MTSPPYLELGFTLKIYCVKCARYRKVTFNSKYHPRMFSKLYAMHTRTLSPALFNNNCKINVIRQMPRMQVIFFKQLIITQITVGLKQGWWITEIAKI